MLNSHYIYSPKSVVKINSSDKFYIIPIWDQKCIFEFFDKTGNVNSAKTSKKWLNKHSDYKFYLEHRYKDSSNYGEILWRIKLNIETIPLCPVCGNPVKYKHNGEYFECCSLKCSAHYDKRNDKVYNTFIKKYGCKYPLQNKNIFNTYKKTMLSKYGCEYSMHSDAIKSKYDFNDIAKKVISNKIKNGTINSSKEEKYIYDKLKIIYPDIIYHYKDSELYPYECDYYIPSKKLFIEYQGYWTHGGHPYDSKNFDDVSRVLDLIEKSKKYKTKNQYQAAVYVWCYHDIEKRNTAVNNNLNYIELWHKDLKNDNFINLIKQK